ncbi:hypothetical protein NT239_15600 [Chitinibacter sp. SCUT-21]|uniref:hypothetical protein n=1 Tax=Chitinibacter sp. SCUT-21 TaxID=2970891 RepID=UPI0035A7081A
MAVTACGGGGGDSSSSPSASATTKALSGVAATGSAIVDATVTIKDSKGATATTKTDTTGSYTFTEAQLSGFTAPFVVQVSGGNIGSATGPANTSSLFSVATSASGSTANITPLTTMLVAALSGQQPSDFFSQIGTTAAPNAATLINSQALATAQSQVINTLKSLGVSGSDLNSIGDFLAGTLQAATSTSSTGNVYDNLLDIIAANPSINIAAVTTQIAVETVTNNGGKSPTGGTPITQSTAINEDTYGGCMAGLVAGNSISGVSKITLTEQPEDRAHWIYTSYKLSDFDPATGNAGWNASRGEDTEGAAATKLIEFPEKTITDFTNDTGSTTTAITRPYKYIVSSQSSANGSKLLKPWYLDLNDYWSPAGRIYWGYKEEGNDDNPGDVGVGKNYQFGFTYKSDRPADLALDGLKKDVEVKYGPLTRTYLKNTDKTGSITYSHTYVGSEIITTKLGAIKACKYTENGNVTHSYAAGAKASDATNITFKTTIWTAPTLGVIRRDYEETGLNSDSKKVWSASQSRELTSIVVGNTNYGSAILNDSTFGACMKSTKLPSSLTATDTSLAAQNLMGSVFEYTANYNGSGYNFNWRKDAYVQSSKVGQATNYVKFAGNDPLVSVNAKVEPYYFVVPGQYQGSVSSYANLQALSNTPAGTTPSGSSLATNFKLNGFAYSDAATNAWLGWREEGDANNPSSSGLVGPSQYFMQAFAAKWDAFPAFWNGGLRKNVPVTDMRTQAVKASWIGGGNDIDPRDMKTEALYTGRGQVTTALGSFDTCVLKTTYTITWPSWNTAKAGWKVVEVNTEHHVPGLGVVYMTDVEDDYTDAANPTVTQWYSNKARELRHAIIKGKQYGTLPAGVNPLP